MIVRAFENGLYPADALVTIDSHGTRLNARAAAVWQRIVADARRAGVMVRATPASAGRPAGLAGYRNLAMQKWLWLHPIGPAKIAPPGSSSHGWGDVVDVDLGADWLWANRARYGVTRPIASEPWHFHLTKTVAELGLSLLVATGSGVDVPKVVRRTGAYREWSLIWPPFVGAASNQLGYVTTTDEKVAGEWERMFADGYGSADMLGASSPKDDNRDAYVRIQDAARGLHEAWRRGQQVAALGQLSVTLTGSAVPK